MLIADHAGRRLLEWVVDDTTEHVGAGTVDLSGRLSDMRGAAPL
ncbi:hypothetical protein [Solirubrobacter ginsenosidimutans]|nr:hypothetical protein [Solirubrobacter ginsenosidimutans]